MKMKKKEQSINQPLGGFKSPTQTVKSIMPKNLVNKCNACRPQLLDLLENLDEKLSEFQEALSSGKDEEIGGFFEDGKASFNEITMDKK